MNPSSRLLGIALASSAGLGVSAAMPVAPAAAAMPVFDSTNYAQNLLQAARALDQINNQVKALQNQAAMLQGMARNLERIDFPQLQKIKAAMQRIDTLMGEAQAIDFKVAGLDDKVRALFPGELGAALQRDRQVLQARARLEAAADAYRRSLRVQAQVAENVQEDAGLLAELSSASQGSVGALQAHQAANQLLALSVKQQLQLQTLMAAEYRESAIERARRTQAAEDGRAMTRRFLDGARSRN